MGIPMAGMRRVIKTLLDPTLSPAKAKWGNEQWRAWRLLTKGKYHIGMELEYKGTNSSTNRATTGLAHSCNSTGVDKFGECVQLFPLSSPCDFTSAVTKFVKTCKKHKIPTLGSVHLNILVKNDENNYGKYIATNNSHYDFENKIRGNKYGITRSENKYFSGFMLEEDLRAQLVFFLGSYTLCTEYRDYSELHQLIMDCYPKDMQSHWARMDFNKIKR